ncbi:hypothetical protein [Serratia marcescens]|uniref:hypothetical protein n=1 Tax=Serratia marcescens TaxID=615 RepID=UPI001C3A5099|nr:hypothetical protein [Serratia marcescens]
MTTIKRFTPDYAMHAARFEPFAREAEHGEYVRFDAHQQTVSALEAERDALAVENAALKSNLMFWDADNPELPYDCPEEIANECELNYNDEFEVQVAARLPNRKYRVCESWEYECKLELVEGDEIETPATDAALAAIRAQGVEKLIKLKMEQLANMHPDTHAFGATAESLRSQINELQAFAAALREAK